MSSISSQSAWTHISRTWAFLRRTPTSWRLWGTGTSTLVLLTPTRLPSMLAGQCGGSFWNGTKCRKCWWTCGGMRCASSVWHVVCLYDTLWALYFQHNLFFIFILSIDFLYLWLIFYQIHVDTTLSSGYRLKEYESSINIYKEYE